MNISIVFHSSRYLRFVEEQRSIVIIGGGISGLSLGAYIKEGGFNSIILEKTDRIGGMLQTVEQDGYLLEYGANTTSSNTALEEIIRIIGLESKVLRPNDNAKKRYILKNNKLRKASPNLKDMLFSSVLSVGAKMKVFQEQYKKPTDVFDEESVGGFFERRFGREFVENLVNPMIAGIYAGDPYQLSVNSVFPKLISLEQEYGSIIKALKKNKDAMPAREIISFKGGMQTLIDALENYIGTENILRETEAKQVVPLENGQFSIQLKQGGLDLEIVADVVVYATPSYVTSEFIRPISVELANLMELHYPKMAVLHLGYDQSQLKKPFDSFGFLVPEQERKSFLGAIANSSFLPGRAPEGKELFTLFLGGVRQEHQLRNNKQALINDSISEFQKIMSITGEPEIREEMIWEHSIPQFRIGHPAILEGFEFFEENIENLHILGNYRSGVSVADCIQGAKRTHGKLIKDYSMQSFRRAKQDKKQTQS